MSTPSSTLEIVETTQVSEPGDHERFAHYVRKADVARSLVEGVPATALCGKKWVPNRDPQKFPVCPDCRKIWEGFKAE